MKTFLALICLTLLSANVMACGGAANPTTSNPPITDDTSTNGEEG